LKKLNLKNMLTFFLTTQALVQREQPLTPEDAVLRRMKRSKHQHSAAIRHAQEAQHFQGQDAQEAQDFQGLQGLQDVQEAGPWGDWENYDDYMALFGQTRCEPIRKLLVTSECIFIEVYMAEQDRTWEDSETTCEGWTSKISPLNCEEIWWLWGWLFQDGMVPSDSDEQDFQESSAGMMMAHDFVDDGSFGAANDFVPDFFRQHDLDLFGASVPALTEKEESEMGDLEGSDGTYNLHYCNTDEKYIDGCSTPKTVRNCPSGWKEVSRHWHGCCNSFWDCFGHYKWCKKNCDINWIRSLKVQEGNVCIKGKRTTFLKKNDGSGGVYHTTHKTHPKC